MAIIPRINNDLIKTHSHSSKVLKGAQAFIEENQGLIFHKGSNWFYIYQQGMYTKLEDCEVRRMIFDTEAIPEIQSWSYNSHSQLINTLKSMRYYGFEEFNQSDLMNFKNCYLDLETLEAHEHSHDFISTFQLPYDYDKDARSDLWTTNINQIIERRS